MSIRKLAQCAVSVGLLFVSFYVFGDAKVIVQPDYRKGVLTREQVQQIYTRSVTHWADGLPIRVYSKPLDSLEHRDFVMNVLQLSPYRYKTLLEEKTFAGKATGVIELLSDEEMKTKVEVVPAAIGYINYELYVNNKKLRIVDFN